MARLSSLCCDDVRVLPHHLPPDTLCQLVQHLGERTRGGDEGGPDDMLGRCLLDSRFSDAFPAEPLRVDPFSVS